MLAAEEIAEIKKCWEIPRADPVASGTAILTLWFTKYPSNLQKFPFRDVPVPELKNSARFKAHCTRIITTFDNTIKVLGDEGAEPKIEEIWKEIANTHVLRHDIKAQAYAELREAIVEILSAVCKLDDQQKVIWNKFLDKVYGIIFKRMEELQAK